MTSIGNDVLEGKVKDWLDKQGYPLEMAVAQKLRNVGILAVQSSYYLDTATNSAREIDVLAGGWCNEGREFGSLYAMAEFEAMFCIECKLSRGKPWVLFRSPHKKRPNKWVPEIVPICSGIAAQYYQWLFVNGVLKQTYLLGSDAPVGYSLAQAFSDGSDIPYKAVRGSLDAALVKVSEVRNEIEHKPGEMYCTGRLVFPTIVFDSQLFECYLDDSGQSQLNEIDFAFLQLDSVLSGRRGVGPESKSMALIYTAKALDALVSHIIQTKV